MTPERFSWIIRSLDFGELSEWETNFVESCERTMKKEKDLSPRQEEILDNIHREKS